MTVRNLTAGPARSRRLRGEVAAIALVFGALTSTGCTREFFREWADQDVTEAIFEKSRDPRWRMEVFSKEPPKLSRYAQPYDPDRPPAPPDDYATERLSPTPQWPVHRLLVPAEGTGYVDMLADWRDRYGYEEQNVGPEPTPVNVIEPTEEKPISVPNPPTDVDPRLHPPVNGNIPPPPAANPGSASSEKRSAVKISANSGPKQPEKTPSLVASYASRPTDGSTLPTRPGEPRQPSPTPNPKDPAVSRVAQQVVNAPKAGKPAGRQSRAKRRAQRRRRQASGPTSRRQSTGPSPRRQPSNRSPRTKRSRSRRRRRSQRPQHEPCRSVDKADRSRPTRRRRQGRNRPPA